MISPQLRAIGPEMRVLDAYIDAIAAYGVECPAVWARVDTAILAERRSGEGWNTDHAKRTMRQWGAKDQYGVYAAARLTKAEAEVAFLRFDRQLDAPEIGRLLGRSAITVRVQLHKVRERLRVLALDAA